VCKYCWYVILLGLVFHVPHARYSECKLTHLRESHFAMLLSLLLMMMLLLLLLLLLVVLSTTPGCPC
jgi:hypothetical protein